MIGIVKVYNKYDKKLGFLESQKLGFFNFIVN